MALWRKLREIPSWIWPAVLLAALLLLPVAGPSYELTRQLQLTLILALVVSGLNLTLGYGGELALGQAAMYAAGAYTAGIMSAAGTSDLAVQILAGGAAALAVGILTGIPGLRLNAWSLAVVSFFLVLLVPDVVGVFEEHTNGNLGLSGMSLPTLLGRPLTDGDFYYAVVIVAALWFVVMRNLLMSRHGLAFQVLKESPVLATSLGMSLFRTKLSLYALGAAPAGLAGALLANQDLFLSPEWFGLPLATGVLAATMLGGDRSIYGALFGAMLVQYGQDQSGEFAEFSLVFFGALLLIAGVGLRGGMAGLARKAIARLDRAAAVGGEIEAATETADLTIPPLRGGTLQAKGISKSFGGNQALTDVSLAAEPGRITAIIGPNGSGKTTLLNLMCGFYDPDDGTMRLDGNPLERNSADRIARKGIARTFQTPLIPPGVTVRDAVASGRYTTETSSFISAILRTPRHRRVHERDRERADEVLQLVGLAPLAEAEAATLSLGRRRMVEVARSVAANPKVLLLDEAASGLDEHEVQTLATVIGRIRASRCTVILVEHNFGLVLSLADTIVVLARGKVLTQGTPEEIAAHPEVRDEYLGVTDDEAVIEDGAASDVLVVRSEGSA